MRHYRVAMLLTAMLAGCRAPADRSTAFHLDTLPNGILHARSDAPRWKDGAGWRVTQDLSIGGTEQGPADFVDIRDIAIDPAGRLYLLDAQGGTIQVFDARGTHVRAIGRKGAGPGEFSDAFGLAIRGDRLYVVDQRNVRISVFDTSGALITTHPRSFANMGVWQWEGGIDSSGAVIDMMGRFGANGLDQHWYLTRLDRDSLTVADSFPLPDYQASAELVKHVPGGTSITRIVLPNAPTLSRVFDPRGYLWYGISDKYRIVKRHLSGDTALVIERAWQPAAIPDSARQRADSFIARLRTDGYDLPALSSTVPAFGGLVIDERGDLWVAPYGLTDATWQVFSSAGEWLGPVTFPSPIRGLTFDAGRYYGTVRDSLDVVRVAGGRIERR